MTTLASDSQLSVPGAADDRLKRPSGGGGAGRWRCSILLWLALFLAGIVSGALAHRWLTAPKPAAEGPLPPTAQLLKPGPWGRLARIPIRISPPAELLPIRSVEAAGTHWRFAGLSRSNWARLLETAGVAPEQRDALLAAGALREEGGGLEVTPPDEVLLELEPGARRAIYEVLAGSPENRSQVSAIPAAAVEDHLRQAGVSPATEALFRKLCVPRDKHLIFSGLSCLLARTPDFEEKVRFMKALTMQETFLLRFHVDAATDIAALAGYWGKGLWSTDVRAILDSLARVPGGVWSSTLLLLPPLPTAQLYTYPKLADNPMNGPATVRDCHWTSLNFFRDEPDPRLSDPGAVSEKLKASYAPIVGDPRYGDIVFFAKPGGGIIHSAVFIADDVVYTKNGDTFVYPWMLSTIPDLIAHYSAQLQPGEKLAVSYFRKKFD